MVGARLGDRQKGRWPVAVGPFLLVLGLLAVVATGPGAPVASASTLEPCPKPPPAPRFDGEGTLAPAGTTKRILRRYGLRQRLISPANSFTGRPTYPLSNAGLSGSRATVLLGGGFRIGSGRGPEIRISGLRLVVRDGMRPAVTAKVAGRQIRLFRVSGAKLELDRKAGVLNLRRGQARLSSKAEGRISSRLGIGAKGGISAGDKWGRISVFAARNQKSDDPEAEAPVEPPFLERAPGAIDITSATIKWRVRESFIRYVAVGSGTSVADGATADPPEEIGGTAPLTYSFNFEFSQGWTATGPGPTLIQGGGRVGFRYCRNTINFTVAEPEIELNGDSDSRLVFRVDGTDGTAFPNSRAVMVQLLPGLVTPTTEGETTTWTDIPGYIPQTATGIFADFYPPFPGDVEAPGAGLSRFGSLTVSYTTG